MGQQMNNLMSALSVKAQVSRQCLHAAAWHVAAQHIALCPVHKLEQWAYY